MNPDARNLLVLAAVTADALLAVACGGGIPVTETAVPQKMEVHVSAGAPVQGATVTIYAVSDATGQVDATAGTKGVLGAGGPTDSSGMAAVTLAPAGYSGPIQVVATGAAMAYPDPSGPASSTGSTAMVQVPSSFSFSSYVARYGDGTLMVLPVTLLTTLADHEALAFARGLHPLHPNKTSLSAALLQRDRLFVHHLTTNETAWAPASLRSTVPLQLADAARTLIDSAYAELFDIALNQLARDTALRAGYGSDSSAINAISLAELLEQDLDADAMFDGKADGGAALKTPSQASPVTIDAQFLRAPLATALDEWIRSSFNTSSIQRADLINAGVYDAMVGDATDLFGAPPNLAFDPAPPKVAATFTYSPANGLQGAAPVGPNHDLVGGLVTVTIDATDVSGVASIAVAVNGSSVPRDPQRSTAGHFVGTWDTTKSPDGPIAFVVTAKDTQNNTGTSTFTVNADNTPPAITVAKPLASAWYSTAIELDVTATDPGTGPSGIASLTQLGLAGFVDADSAPAHLFGTWATDPVPVGASSVNATFTATDVVGNSTSVPVSIRIDRTPPALSWAVAPPTAIQAPARNPAFTLSVGASDLGAGVRAVHARVGSRSQADGTLQADGTWSVVVGLEAIGHNAIAIWADDKAVPVANAGVNGAAPYQLAADILVDNVAPTATVDGAFASYYDERGMTAATDASGRALVPAQYWYAGNPAQRSVVANGQSIYKTATRLSAGGAPSIGELEGRNAANIPVLRYVVPYAPATDAAIVMANYSVTVNCAGCAFALATGALWPSARTDSSNLYYDLPLSAEVVPALSLVSGAATVAVTLSLADAAGNAASVGPFTYNFHVIGPAIAITEDVGYATSGDPKAAVSYGIGSPAYASLFAYSPTFLPEQQVRLGRYLVTNPAPLPVGVKLAVNASNQVIETWSYDHAPMQGTYAVDGSLFSGAVQWGDQCDSIAQYPLESYGSNPQSWTFPVHANGNVTPYLPGNVNDPSWTPSRKDQAPQQIVAATGAVAPLAYVSPYGYDASPAQASSGFYIVPAAQAGVPGQLAVYVTRPSSTSRPQRPLSFGKVNPASPTPPRFELWLNDAWLSDGVDRACTHMVSHSANIQSDPSACTAYGAGPNATANGGGCRWMQDPAWNSMGYPCACWGPIDNGAGSVVWGYAGIQDLSYTFQVDAGSTYRNWQSYRFESYLSQSTEQLVGAFDLQTQGLLGSAQLFGEAQTIQSGVPLTRNISH